MQELRSNNDYDNTIIAFLTARNEDFTQVQGLMLVQMTISPKTDQTKTADQSH